MIKSNERINRINYELALQRRLTQLKERYSLHYKTNSALTDEELMLLSEIPTSLCVDFFRWTREELGLRKRNFPEALQLRRVDKGIGVVMEFNYRCAMTQLDSQEDKEAVLQRGLQTDVFPRIVLED